MPDNKRLDSAQSGAAHENSAQVNPSVAVNNNPCSICRANRVPPPCRGHGGQSGGGSDSEKKADKSDKQAPANTPGQLIDTMGQVVVNATTQALDYKGLSQQSQLTEKIFNQEIISDLLSKNILVINNDRDSGILTIKLQCKPNLLSEEQKNEFKKFVDTILEELDEFKKEKGILTNCETVEQDNVGNFLSLRITLPTPTAYDAFIQRLASKNLLLKQNIEQKENVAYEENMNHFNPTPLSMKPSPILNKGVKSTEDEKDKIENQDEAAYTPTFR